MTKDGLQKFLVEILSCKTKVHNFGGTPRLNEPDFLADLVKRLPRPLQSEFTPVRDFTPPGVFDFPCFLQFVSSNLALTATAIGQAFYPAKEIAMKSTGHDTHQARAHSMQAQAKSASPQVANLGQAPVPPSRTTSRSNFHPSSSNTPWNLTFLRLVPDYLCTTCPTPDHSLQV